MGLFNQKLNNVAIAKESFNRKISILTSTLNTEVKKKLVLNLQYCFTWARELDTKRIRAEMFGELRNVMLELQKNGEDQMVRESN